MLKSLLFKTRKRLISQGISYQILHAFKQVDSKQVFKALRKDEKDGVEQEVILKIFLNQKKNYQEEFESLSKVQSAYCVRLLGFENFSDKKTLVLEYIKGVSLAQLIKTFALNQEEIQYILTCVYKGLLDLSRQGFCHGDLSLDNILIDERAHIKLIDFGEANYGQEIHGTVPFIAPEIFKGARANFLSDLFSLGIIESILKTPFPLSSLKNMELKDFESNSPLLSLDPQNRKFIFNSAKKIPKRDLKAICYKVKDLLAVMDSKYCSTVKNPQKTRTIYQIFLSFFIIILISLSCISSSQAYSPLHGFLKIYTNQWFLISISGFQAYSPLHLPLKKGWYTIHWKNINASGKKKIFISHKKTVLLKDEHFLTKRNL